MTFNRKSQEDPLILIDPPVTPYSAPDEIRAWIEQLQAMPQIPFVPESIREAQQWLEWSEEHSNSDGQRPDFSDE